MRETSLGYFITPLVNVLLGVIVLGERLRPRRWCAVALAAAGVRHLTFGYGSLPWIAIGLALSFGSYGLVPANGSPYRNTPSRNWIVGEMYCSRPIVVSVTRRSG